MSTDEGTLSVIASAVASIRSLQAQLRFACFTMVPPGRRRKLIHKAIDLEATMAIAWWEEHASDSPDQALLDKISAVQYACMEVRNHFRKDTE